MAATQVYDLRPVLDDRRFEGFACDSESIRGKLTFPEDFLPDSPAIDQQAPRLAAIWKPPAVTGRVRPHNDYPCVNLIIPAVSRRAVDALRDLLGPNGELLPLRSDIGEYFIYHVTTMVDVLDRDRSDVRWFSDDPGPWDARAMTIDHFEFVPGRLEGLTIFNIPELAGDPLVTDAFKERVEAAGLQGFDFVKVWPLPRGTNWRQLHKKKRR